jgi:hypothetical protein
MYRAWTSRPRAKKIDNVSSFSRCEPGLAYTPDLFNVRYSFLQLLRQGLSGHRGWPRAWRSAEPAASYDAVVVGGGGHGLATAWHLVRDEGLSRVAVLERGWLGGGNTGRNTTVIRSNYLREPGIRFQDENLRLWEDLSQRLDDFDGAVESHDGDAVIGTKAANDACRAFASGFEGLAVHRAGAVDHKGEVEGGTGSLSGIGGLGRGDEADEDMRRISGGAEEALLEGQDFDLGLVHRRNHRLHYVPPLLKCQHHQRYFRVISTRKLLS